MGKVSHAPCDVEQYRGACLVWMIKRYKNIFLSYNLFLWYDK